VLGLVRGFQGKPLVKMQLPELKVPDPHIADHPAIRPAGDFQQSLSAFLKALEKLRQRPLR
jgi:hypothetical protein